MLFQWYQRDQISVSFPSLKHVGIWLLKIALDILKVPFHIGIIKMYLGWSWKEETRDWQVKVICYVLCYARVLKGQTVTWDILHWGKGCVNESSLMEQPFFSILSAASQGSMKLQRRYQEIISLLGLFQAKKGCRAGEEEEIPSFMPK